MKILIFNVVIATIAMTGIYYGYIIGIKVIHECWIKLNQTNTIPHFYMYGEFAQFIFFTYVSFKLLNMQVNDTYKKEVL